MLIKLIPHNEIKIKGGSKSTFNFISGNNLPNGKACECAHVDISVYVRRVMWTELKGTGKKRETQKSSSGKKRFKGNRRMSSENVFTSQMCANYPD